MDLGLVLGAVLVQVSIAAGGLRAALLAPAVIAATLVAGLWRRLDKLDEGASVPQVEIRLLRSISIFAALPPPALEGIARELEPVSVTAGSTLFHEGDRDPLLHSGRRISGHRPEWRRRQDRFPGRGFR